jgi:hypothetical protein
MSGIPSATALRAIVASRCWIFVIIFPFIGHTVQPVNAVSRSILT